jgi:hypothetical protein
VKEGATCAECQTRYDDTLPFCPRCGSTARAASVAAAVPQPVRRGGARGRAHLGATIILVVALFFAAGAFLTALAPEEQMRTALDGVAAGIDQGSANTGAVHIQVLANATPLAGANVTVRTTTNVRLASGVTDAFGWYNASAGGHAAVRVNVTARNVTLERGVLLAAAADATVRLDVARDPSTAPHWLGTEDLLGLLRGAAWVLGGLSVLAALGAIAGLALRWKGLALGGPLPLVTVAALLFAYTLSLPVLAVAVVVVGSYGLMVSGRTAFRR